MKALAMHRGQLLLVVIAVVVVAKVLLNPDWRQALWSPRGAAPRLWHTAALLDGALTTVERSPKADDPQWQELASRIRDAKEKADAMVMLQRTTDQR